MRIIVGSVVAIALIAAGTAEAKSKQQKQGRKVSASASRQVSAPGAAPPKSCFERGIEKGWRPNEISAYCAGKP
jgi:hypothetical protein